MAVVFGITYKKNDGSGTQLVCESGSKNLVDYITFVGQNWGETPQNWSRDGFAFQHWNTAADDSGTSYNGGDLYSGASVTLYAIWQADTPVGKDVSVTLGNTEIASLSDTGSVTLATAGTYVDEDITIDYTKSGGGGAANINITITDEIGMITEIYKPTTADISLNYPDYSGTIPAKSMICCICTISPYITDAINVTYEIISRGSRPITHMLMIYLTDQDGTITLGNG